MSKHSLAAHGMFACAFLTACSAATDERVAPGVLDLAVLQGSYVPTPCPPLELHTPRTTLVGCVAYPQQEPTHGVTWDNAYVVALGEHGWRLWNGAANVYWLERAIPGSDCSDRLDLVFWVLPTPEEQAALASGAIDFEEVRVGTIHFFKHDQATCGDARSWLRTNAQ